MKKIAVFSLLFAMLALSACGQANSDQAASDNPTAPATEAPATSAPTMEAPATAVPAQPTATAAASPSYDAGADTTTTNEGQDTDQDSVSPTKTPPPSLSPASSLTSPSKEMTDAHGSMDMSKSMDTPAESGKTDKTKADIPKTKTEIKSDNKTDTKTNTKPAQSPEPATKAAPSATNNSKSSENAGSTANPNTAKPSTAKPEKPASREYTVEISNFSFSTPKLEIHSGDIVTFINRDEIKHSATADDHSFDTGLLGKDESKSVTFAKAGEYGYHCTPHPGMQATIVVKD